MRISNLLVAVTISAMLPLTSACATTTQAATVAAPFAGCKTGTPEANIAVVRNFYVAYNTGDADLLRKTLAEGYVSEPVAPGAPTGVEPAVERMKMTVAIFGSPQVENVEFIVSGNKVVVRSNIAATHSGPFFGLAATGKPLRFGAIDIHTVCDGKIVHGNHEENWLAVMLQLGVLPIKP